MYDIYISNQKENKMCNDFSCIVTKSHRVIWERGISSHDALYSKYLDQYPELRETSRSSVKVEITPTKGYLYPKAAWNFEVDEEEKPDWWTASHELEAIRAMQKWRTEVYSLINIEEARNPINPQLRKRKPTKNDIELLQAWASVGDSVRASVWASVWDGVGASVRDSVRASVVASVGAYIGSLFYIWGDVYKFQPCVDLWRRGFVPSFDGTTWRLHSGKNAEIVYEWKP